MKCKYNISKERIRFGKEILGPIIYEFCERLYLHLNMYDDRDTVILFQSRDGLRIRYLFETFLRKNSLTIKKPMKDLYVSRLSVSKACLIDDYEYISTFILNEFKRISRKDFLHSLLDEYPASFQHLDRFIDKDSMNSLINSREYIDIGLKDHLLEQSRLFNEYFNSLVEGKKNIILIDTGWLGNTQSMLMRQYKDKNFIGLYFGAWDYKDLVPDHFKEMIGISIDDDSFYPTRIRSPILYYHHMIEHPLEARLPTVKKYMKKGKLVLPDIRISKVGVAPDLNDDEFFTGIVRHFNDTKKKNLTPLDIHKEATVAYQKLSRRIMFPRKKDIDVMQINNRNSGMGRKKEIDAIIKDSDLIYPVNKPFNILRSVWKQGQIRYEFPVIAPIFLLMIYIYSLMKGKVKLVF